MLMATRSPEFRRLRAALGRLASDAFPKAIAEALNVVAGLAHGQQARNIRSKFTIRNKYTERSLRFYKARGMQQISRINAVTGSISEYLPLHESGGVRKPKRGSKVPVATLAARGGNRSNVVLERYAAGQLGPNQFVGTPRGSPTRPNGVYERYNLTKQLKMIRNLEHEQVTIRGNQWHSDAVNRYAKRSVLEAEFIRQAERALREAGAT